MSRLCRKFYDLFGLNQRDNLIDTAINYQLEIIEVEDRHTLFRQYDDPDNFYDQVIRDSLEHDINSIYINLNKNILVLEEKF